MSSLVLVIFMTMLLNCSAAQVYFKLSNDPNYPQLISVSNVHHNLVTNEYIDISATVTIYEEINDGTNVNGFLVRMILSSSTNDIFLYM